MLPRSQVLLCLDPVTGYGEGLQTPPAGLVTWSEDGFVLQMRSSFKTQWRDCSLISGRTRGQESALCMVAACSTSCQSAWQCSIALMHAFGLRK